MYKPSTIQFEANSCRGWQSKGCLLRGVHCNLLRKCFRESSLKRASHSLGTSPQVVFVSSLVLTLLDFSPLVFLQEAEGSVGQFDVEITSDGSTGYVSVNYTQIEESTTASTQPEEVRI